MMITRIRYMDEVTGIVKSIQGYVVFEDDTTIVLRNSASVLNGWKIPVDRDSIIKITTSKSR